MQTLPPNLPYTFGCLSNHILSRFYAFSNIRVDVVFDIYPMPSIKDYETAQRTRNIGTAQMEFYVIAYIDQSKSDHVASKKYFEVRN